MLELDHEVQGQEQRWTWCRATPLFLRVKPGLVLEARAVMWPQLCSWQAAWWEQAARRPSHQKPRPDFSGTSKNRCWNRVWKQICSPGESHASSLSHRHAAKPVPLRLGAQNCSALKVSSARSAQGLHKLR